MSNPQSVAEGKRHWTEYPCRGHSALNGVYWGFILAAVVGISMGVNSWLYPPADPDLGWIDSAECGEVTGWAWNQESPKERVEVHVKYKSATQYSSEWPWADQERGDLKLAGVGDGKHGFQVKTGMVKRYGSKALGKLTVAVVMGGKEFPLADRDGRTEIQMGCVAEGERE